MHIHILGICGTFMGGLAALARQAGHTVTGCDAGVYPPMSDQLRALGIDLIEGYDGNQIDLAPDVFVIGNVIKRGNPLMEAILDKGLPYVSGPQWLAEHILPGRHVLAVAGTHGKTTTTSMLAWILEANGRKPGFLIGGVPQNFGVSARLGGSPYFVIEADEYDTAFFDKRSKFVHYRPRTLVLNNLEMDHADIFEDIAAIEKQFHHVVRTVPQSGRVIFNDREESLHRVLQRGCWSELLSFGTDRGFWSEVSGGVWATASGSSAAIYNQQRFVGQLDWNLIGEHNHLNALAAVAAAEHIGIPAWEALAALRDFESVKRRMELRGRIGDIAVYDDFAHHPTAIRFTVDALRQQIGDSGRILAVFEPRSNTMKLGTMRGQLPWALENADLAFCHAGGLTWNAADALEPLCERAKVADSVEQLVDQVLRAAEPGDRIVCMSNGSFGGVHEKLIAALRQAAA